MDYLTTNTHLFFWNGFLSQWYPSEFVVGDVSYNCAEQYMMAEKARCFNDKDSLENIMGTTSPRVQKSIGRKIKNFDEKQWSEICDEVVKQGSIAKFNQNKYLGQKLKDTGRLLLVEASPYDRIWGIGMTAEKAARTDPSKWNGKNKLGKILTEVRDKYLTL